MKFFLWISALFILALVACSGGDEGNPVKLSEEDRLFVQQENPPGFHESFDDYIWVVYVDKVGRFYSDSKPQVTLDSGGTGGYICMDGFVVGPGWKKHNLYPYGHCVGSGGKNHYRVYPQWPIN